MGSYNYQRSVSCTSDGYCVSTGNYGEILARGTFGATWRSRASGTMDTLEGVSCWSIHQCVAVGVPVNATGGLNDTAVLLLNTHDGDNSWHGQPAGTSQGLNGVGCSIDGRCVAVGLGGTILGSSNGGASWAPQSSGTGRDLWGVSCQDRARCVVAGKGIILSIVDGGVSWHGRSPGTSWPLAGASCPDADHCVLVGDNGVILTTSKFPF